MPAFARLEITMPGTTANFKELHSDNEFVCWHDLLIKAVSKEKKGECNVTYYVIVPEARLNNPKLKFFGRRNVKSISRRAN